MRSVVVFGSHTSLGEVLEGFGSNGYLAAKAVQVPATKVAVGKTGDPRDIMSSYRVGQDTLPRTG